MYPLYVEINGEKHKINTDYKVALKCLKIADDDEISDIERSLAIVYKLFGCIPDNIEPFLIKAKTFLECGASEEPEQNGKADMDLLYDQKYIKASFMSDYHIDIEKTEMHYWQYIELIEAFTEQSIMSRVRQLRNIDVKDYPKKERAKIEKAKAQVALPKKLTKEEQERSNQFWAQFGGD